MTPLIELSVLSPAASVETLYAAFDEVHRRNFAALTVPPFWVKKLHRDWSDSLPSTLSTAVGYPYGYQRTEAKQTETEWALRDGAREIQVVLNTSAWFSNSNGWPKIEFAKLAKLIHQHEAIFTVIIEADFFDEPNLDRALKTAADAGADYVQNATGVFSPTFDIEKALLFKRLTPSQVGCKIWAQNAANEDFAKLQEHAVERLCLPFIR
ncbi:deoxyribose-phosphate aldolase/phospho-2-dehydro-3-deoxyheptonate aldolase [Runella slithyformis]|uniref:Deoxyribose-phosphate aldolase/phospho-2-dehydro-3-deoxyheptonate aldolase n=1 Tax=Runella slithyformis (strain ATCC 29530 / DSM 19594 / LMG 11500 / NCIMB 11436 / LSU 4) TaxID=761193 RepID=A0A7U4E5Q7_RUNSL|nr:deoxyribose-phosphate aldolase/phospho-2-dehydro-3-deoxyheptonate aldolase [Runella slithyformis]AEI48579.1 deoxyribose-phosphate aldolase/phospho-2-dehydro-3-deoxyheptonate aldolase [Runella slithyformis DSM 19594]